MSAGKGKARGGRRVKYSTSTVYTESMSIGLRCREAQRELPLLLLEGLLPEAPPPEGRFGAAALRRFDGLLDAPHVAAREFRQTLGGKKFWRSALQPAQLRALAADCPHAMSLRRLRRTCAGFFLTVEQRERNG